MTSSAWPQVLTKFAQQPSFESVLAEVFGSNVDWNRAQVLQEQWLSQDFTALPPVIVLPAASMPTAAGAYARSTQTIYLNQDWLATATPSEIEIVLLEELGHYLEHVLIGDETPGDEGKLFAARILGTQLNSFATAQDDSGFIAIDAHLIAVETSAFSTANQTQAFNTDSNNPPPSLGDSGDSTNFFNGGSSSQNPGDSPGSFNTLPPLGEFTPGGNSNSGIPLVTLAVSPSTVAEDNGNKLIYTFTRTGNTSNVLSVNFTVGGTATWVDSQLLFDDYSHAGTASFSATAGTVVFFPGSSTATVEIAPQFDTTIEANETVAFTLAPGAGYEIGTVGTVTGTILNDDYQSIVPPTDSTPINHKLLEVLAKDLIYKDWDANNIQLEETLNQSQYNIHGFEYRLDQTWGSSAPNFYAIGLIADNAPPILVTRGTNDLLDWTSNRDSNGVGFEQFYNYRVAIDQWLNTLSERGYSNAYITGHSLGGALAQWFGSYYTSFRQTQLAGVVTFNSPGISQFVRQNGEEFGTKTFQKSLVDDVVHYIASGDIVSLFGDDFIEGDVSILKREGLYTPIWSPHLDPILVDKLPENNRSKPEGILSDLSIQQLNSPLFNYAVEGGNFEYIAARLLIAKASPLLAAAMTNRGELNLALNLVPNREALTQGLLIAQNLSESVIEALLAVGNLGVTALTAMENWGVDAWEAASNLTVDAWRNAQSWTAATWQSTADFTTNQWNALVGTLSGTVDTTFNFISSTVSNIFNTSVTVSLAQPSDTEVAVSYQSVDGTAIAGQDYVAVSGTLVFAPGETEKKVPIQLFNKGSIEEAKTFEFRLSNPQNVELIVDDKILVNIKPNEAPILQNPITPQTAFVNEYFFFKVPEDTFTDADLKAGDQLQYEVSLANGDPLPGWLTFDSKNGFLVGTPSPIDLDNLELKVTAAYSPNFGTELHQLRHPLKT